MERVPLILAYSRQGRRNFGNTLWSDHSVGAEPVDLVRRHPEIIAID